MSARLLAKRSIQGLRGMRRLKMPVPFLLALVMSALLLAGLFGAPRAFAVITAVGPTVPVPGTTPAVSFPAWYKAPDGIALKLCLDAANCAGATAADLNPANPGAAGEAFWTRAQAEITQLNGARALLTLALEAAFFNGPPVAGEEITFSRVRVTTRTALFTNGATYTVVHPYGTEVLVGNALGQLVDPATGRFLSRDLGCAVLPCNFADPALMTAQVGPFLRWDPAVAPAAPAGFIGDGGVLGHPVIGSPTGNNFFRISGPEGVNTVTDFFITGQLAVAAADDTATVPAGSGPVPIDVLANDAPPPLTVSAVTAATNGATAIATLGTATWVTYDNNGTAGTDVFTYTAASGGITGTARVNITAHAGNAAPVAVNDAFTVTVGSVGNVLNVLSPTIGLADSDADGDVIFVSAVTQPVSGTVSVGAAGRNVVYNAGATTGPTTFTYTLSDGLGTSVGTVTVNINTPPVAANDVFTVTANTTNNALAVLANDTDADGNVLTVSAVGTPTNGTAAIGAGGANVLYTPTPSFGGTGVFTYTVTDGAATASATVTVTVNRPPVAAADAIPVAINSAGNVLNVMANDNDPDGTSLIITAIGAPAKGTASIGAGGANIVYTPNAGAFGADPFTYTISEVPAGGPGVLTATATVSVTIDRAPVAGNDVARAPQNSTNNAVNVLANDSDPDGNTLTVTAVTQPSNGTAAVGAGGVNVTYTPSTNFVGTDAFSYVMSDGFLTATARVTMTVHRGPVATNDSVKVAQNSSNNVVNVLANDFDPDGDAIFVSAVTQGTSGSVAIGTGGANVTYSPNPNFSGPDSFTYTVSDGQITAVATVLVTVNRPPLAANDVVTVQRNTIANPINVLANDSDPDGNAISVVSVTQGASGTAAVGPGGLVALYTPNAGFAGSDAFTYTISDGQLTVSANVGVIVPDQRTTNSAPTAANDSATVARNSSSNAINVLGNDTDPDGDALRIITVGTAAHGVVTIGAGGAIALYTPNAGFSGSDSFSYTITDGALTASASAGIVVSVNAPPVAVDDNFFVPRNSTNNRLPVLANDSDPERDALTVISVSSAANGVTAKGADAMTVTYTPNSGFTGSDSFTYTISDGAQTSSARVNVTVHLVNNAPVALGDSVTVPMDSGSNFLDVLVNDIDPDGDPVAVASVTQGANGAVAIALGRGKVLYTPKAKFSGTDTFTYTVTDGAQTSSSATVTVSVRGTKIWTPILTQGAIPGW